MKTRILLLVIFMLISLLIFAQLKKPDSLKIPKIYKTWVKTNTEPFDYQGLLFKVDDSSIVVFKTFDHHTNFNLVEQSYIPAMKIEQLSFRRKGSASMGAIVGGLIGFSVGAIIGFVTVKSPHGGLLSMSPGATAFIYGTALMIPGAVLGTYFGSPIIVFNIKGDLNKYHKQKDKIEKYKLKDR